MRKLIYGVGINDFDKPIQTNGVKLKEYILWQSMIERCYSEKYHIKHSNYKGCKVEDYLHSFTNFYNFIRSCKSFELDFQMDKDILSPDEKIYSRDTICFIPRQINTFLTNSKLNRGIHPIGVTFIKESNKFRSQLRIDGKIIILGLFNTPVEAFNVYKEAKEQQAKVLAERWRDKIDERVYNALMNYTVKITD